jgi:MGT family glycosyltransferase
MSHVAVLTIPATGHTLPVLDVVTELRARGHRVTHLTTDAFGARAKAAGADVVTYSSTLVSRPAAPAAAADLALWLPFVLVNEAVTVLPQLLDSLRSDVPDLLLYDRAAYPTARALAQRWDRPAVVLFASFAQGPAWTLAGATGQRSVLDPAHPAYAPLQERLDAFTGQWGVDPIGVEALSQARERASIAFLPRRFQWNGDAFGPEHHFVGPCLTSRLPPAKGAERLLYVSAGTTAADVGTLSALAAEVAAAAPGHRVLVSTGGLPAEALEPLPARVEVREHVDQVAVLARADAFVTHAGMGGVLEALWFGVPMVCLPRTTEQELVAARVEALGLGLVPDRSRSVGAALGAMRADRAMAERLRAFAPEVRAAGGPAAAADVAEATLR